MPPGNRPAVPRDSDLSRTLLVRRKVPRDKLGTGETRGRPASGSSSLQLGEKDGQIRGRSRWFVHNAGYGPLRRSTIDET